MPNVAEFWSVNALNGRTSFLRGLFYVYVSIDTVSMPLTGALHFYGRRLTNSQMGAGCVNALNGRTSFLRDQKARLPKLYPVSMP